jgi:hypothetical protein
VFTVKRISRLTNGEAIAERYEQVSVRIFDGLPRVDWFQV